MFVFLQLAAFVFEVLAEVQQFVFARRRPVTGGLLVRSLSSSAIDGLGVLQLLVELADGLGLFLEQRFVFLEAILVGGVAVLRGFLQGLFQLGTESPQLFILGASNSSSPAACSLGESAPRSTSSSTGALAAWAMAPDGARGGEPAAPALRGSAAGRGFAMIRASADMCLRNPRRR